MTSWLFNSKWCCRTHTQWVGKKRAGTYIQLIFFITLPDGRLRGKGTEIGLLCMLQTTLSTQIPSHECALFTEERVRLVFLFAFASDAVCAPCNFLFENNAAALSPINNAQRRTIIFPVSWMDTGNLGVNNPAPRCRSFVAIWQQACSACVLTIVLVWFVANILYVNEMRSN